MFDQDMNSAYYQPAQTQAATNLSAQETSPTELEMLRGRLIGAVHSAQALAETASQLVIKLHGGKPPAGEGAVNHVNTGLLGEFSEALTALVQAHRSIHEDLATLSRSI